MKYRRLLLAFISIAVSTVVGGLAHAQKIQPLSTQYIFPLNASTNLPRATTIIIRPGQILNSTTVKASLLTVSGSFSGKHSGIFVLSDDKKTLVFTPTILFTYTERVTVKLASGIRATTGALVDPVSFYFTIQSQPKRGTTGLLSVAPIGTDTFFPKGSFLPAPEATLQFIPTIIDRPSPGAIILAPWWSGIPSAPDTSYLSIINDSGRSLWGMPTFDEFLDFKLNTDGRYTYYDVQAVKFYAMDSAFNVVDSFACGGGYWTDLHDIELLPHNHALLISCDTEDNVDLRGYAVEGNQDAAVVGCVIMEIDSMKNPVWIWRSLDSGGYTVPDMIEFPLGLDAPTIDAVHANSVFKDTDGNIVLSARHLDEITKINYDADTIMWRFGGRNNQFALSGDSLWFSHQHHVRRIDNGDFTLFDNGNDHYLHTPSAGPYSRACEYQLDEQAKTAKLVWQFDEGKTDTSSSMGSVERLSNGNTFICWGYNNDNSNWGPSMTEVRPDGSIAFEMYLAFPFLTYRAFRLPSNTSGFADAVSQTASVVQPGVTLSVPYPNPCSGFSSMTVDLPSSMTLDIRVYDALGHEVSRIASGLFAPGLHTVGFDATGLANGVYHCVLRANSGIIARDIVVSK